MLQSYHELIQILLATRGGNSNSFFLKNPHAFSNSSFLNLTNVIAVTRQ